MESIGSFIRLGTGPSDEMNVMEATELHLGLPGTSPSASSAAKKTKRPFEEEATTDAYGSSSTSSTSSSSSGTDLQQEEMFSTRPAKSQIVGWPPVQAFRRNARLNPDKQSSKATEEPCTTAQPTTALSSSSAILVKVSMDGAPYLRKIDLGAYQGYKDLRLALDAMFQPSSSSSPAAQPNSNMLTYQDKDGDWMLVGDVPWEMFADSCKRLRIVKSSTSTESRA